MLSVQDADKLDAIGATGVMRCAAYSCKTNRPLHAVDSNGQLDPTCSIQHFHDKLLNLKDMLKTGPARSEGLKRHQFLEAFLAQLATEV